MLLGFCVVWHGFGCLSRLLRLANVCDLHVVDKANRMITELAAAYGYQPPRVNHA